MIDLQLNKAYEIENLDLLKSISENFIDLIYIDPPFYSNKKYQDFNDKWTSIEEYLEFMEIRIKEMHRILKETGSFYLHCDWHCSHYLKILLDKIFGYDNFKNEIIWYYPNKSHSYLNKTKHTRSHNTILFYAKSTNYYYNPIKEKVYFDSHNFPNKDENGRCYRIVGERRIYEGKGYRNSHDVWSIYFINGNSPERVDYPTQKPEELLERIILSSSNEGDIIADFFCGNGTTLSVAKRLRRRFIGCDNNPKAIEITNNRLNETNVFKSITEF